MQQNAKTSWNNLTCGPIHLAIFAMLLMQSIFPSQSIGQVQIDLNSSTNGEYLITNSLNETGNVDIYVSMPDWIMESGYCPVHVRVVPRRGRVFKTDGTIEVQIANGYFRSESGPRSIITVPLEQGASEAHGEMLANIYAQSGIAIEARLNGLRLRGQLAYIWSNRFGGARPAGKKNLTIVSSESVSFDRRKRSALTAMRNNGRWYAGTSEEGYLADAEKLPTNWLEYNHYRGISIGSQDFKKLPPDAARSLNNYVMAGGVLSISSVRSVIDVSRILPLDLRRVEISPAKAAEPDSADKSSTTIKETRRDMEVQDVVLESVRLSDFESSFDWIEDSLWDRFHRLSVMEGMAQGRRAQSGMTPAPTQSDFWWLVPNLQIYFLEIGRAYLDMQISHAEIIVSRIDEIANATNPIELMEVGRSSAEPSVAALSNTAGPALKSNLAVRHGFGIVNMDPSRGNDSIKITDVFKRDLPLTINRVERFRDGIGDDFWAWLIPSVGQTPVIPFLLFVGLFVGLVVPGLLIWCNRHKRRVWLVVTMPATALLFTVVLFGFGILKDGLGGVSRCRSFAMLDQNGDGIVWSRQSYFSARLPANGMTLNEQTQLAVLAVNSSSFSQTSDSRTVDSKQQYQGLLLPRLQSQFSITHPLSKPSVFRRGDPQDATLNAPTIINEMDTSWTIALFVDAAEKHFIASDVADGQEASWTEMDAADAMERIRKVYLSQSLRAPIDAPSADQTSLNQQFQDFFSYNRARTNNVNLIHEEDFWANHCGVRINQRGGNRTISAVPMLPGTFMVISKQAPYLERCLPNTPDREGLHAILGHW
jgi:hypothetical protein